MSQEQDTRTAERALCALHGLHYDPRLRRSCVLCRREQEPAAPAQHRGMLVGSLLMLIASALGLGTALGVLPLSGGAEQQALEPRSQPTAAASVVPRQTPSAADERSARYASRAALQQIPPGELPSAGLSLHALRGELGALQADLQAGASVDEQDDKGRTALSWAVLGAQSEAVEALIRAKADIELTTYAGHTPLMLAAQAGHARLCTWLIEHGATVNSADRHALTALMLAARAQHVGATSVLLAHGVALEQRCDRAMTALAHAAEASAGGTTLLLLLAAGADIEATDTRGATPLMLAAGAGRLDNVRTLLDGQARIDARDRRDQSALDYVIRPREPLPSALHDALRAVLLLLLERGIDRRLGQKPAQVQVLFRAELDALASSEARPALPAYAPDQEAAPDVRPGAVEQTVASVRLWGTQRAQNSRSLPTRLLPEALIGYQGWTRVPNVVACAEIQALSLQGGQRAVLSSNREGHQPWTVDDVLLLEVMHGGKRSQSAFVGTADQLTLDGQRVQRLGQPGTSFGPGDAELTALLSGGADRIVISLLDYGGVASSSALYLSIQGRDAANTVARARVVAR